MEKGDWLKLKTLRCSNLKNEIDSLLEDGYRLDMIMPADDPREAIVSKDCVSIRLMLDPLPERSEPPAIAGGLTESSQDERLLRIVHATAGGSDSCADISHRNAQFPNSDLNTPDWVKGRAGMEYRDLIPDRLGGRVIASHIRITKAGEVPDYVHYHKVRFQMIYCKSGSIRVVYEDQGPPFVLEAGDCVLQPPEIRHRVLESSAGAEVIEISSPAEHETWVEHEIKLPTGNELQDRDFNGQRFVRHIRKQVEWLASGQDAHVAETDIETATNGLGSVRTLTLNPGGAERCKSGDPFLFLYVLSGAVALQSGSQELRTGDHAVITSQKGYDLSAIEGSAILEVRLREI